jgi:hypothetical protein
MAGPIYKLWMMRLTEAAHQLSEEEQNAAVARTDEAMKEVGGKRVVLCKSRWASEQWEYFGIDEFPSIEAVQEFADLTEGGGRYSKSFSILGIKWPPS